MVPSRSRKTAGRGVLGSGRAHLGGGQPGLGGGGDGCRRDAGHAAVIGGTAAQEAGAAVGFHLDDGAAGGDWSGALGVGGAKDSDDREANGGGYVHRAGVVADEEMALGEERGEIGDGGFAG